MSENQQPLTEEEQTTPSAESMEDVSAEAEQSSLPAADEETVLADTESDAESASEDEQEAEAPEEEQDIDPADVRIFGLPRVCFHFTAGGIAVGYILCGLLGMLAQHAEGTFIGDLAAKTPNVTLCAIVFAVIGYFIGSHRNKKRLAAKEAALEAAKAEDSKV